MAGNIDEVKCDSENCQNVVKTWQRGTTCTDCIMWEADAREMERNTEIRRQESNEALIHSAFSEDQIRALEIILDRGII